LKEVQGAILALWLQIMKRVDQGGVGGEVRKGGSCFLRTVNLLEWTETASE